MSYSQVIFKRPLFLLAIALSVAEVVTDDTSRASANQPQAGPDDLAADPTRPTAAPEALPSRQQTAIAKPALQVQWSPSKQATAVAVSQLTDLSAARLGSQGDSVYQLQSMLSQHGFQTPMNGVFDGRTYRQLVLFQGGRGLEARGQVDSQTVGALQAPQRPLPTPKPEADLSSKILKRGSRGALVEQVQRRLVYQGYALKIDGIFGAETQRAISAFQKAEGLKVDGIVGPKTVEALRVVNPL